MEKVLRVRRKGELNYFLARQKENGLVDFVHGYPLDREELAETAGLSGIPEDQWNQYLGYAE